MAPLGPIQHVVVFFKENHGFDNYFGTFPGANGATMAHSSNPPIRDPDHNHRAWLDRAKGAVRQQFTESDIPDYFAYARRFTLCDNYYTDVAGPSTPNHLMLLTADSPVVDNPPGNPVYDLPSLPSSLDTAGLTWGNYGGYAFGLIKALKGHPQLPSDQFGKDAAGGKLAAVSWVYASHAYSEHPPDPQDRGANPAVGNVTNGMRWTVDQVNAIVQGGLWPQTAIFITWDDWGGWYDHVNPPEVEKWTDGTQFRYGSRVGCLVLSPYAKTGYISKVQHSHVSLIKFCEKAFELPALNARDDTADDMSDCFDFTQKPVPPPPSKIAQPGPPSSSPRVRNRRQSQRRTLARGRRERFALRKKCTGFSSRIKGGDNEGRKSVKLAIGLILFSLILAFAAPRPSEAPTGFDNKSNGLTDDASHQADQTKFEEIEQLADGLGPLYNAQSCRECHQNPVSGAASQVTELRVGHRGSDGLFQNPEIPIAHGAEVIKNRSLVNDRAICPNAAFPNTEIQERVPESETIRTTRQSLNLLGDGFVEAVTDQTLIDLASQQCKHSHRKICGQILYVPIVEAPGQTGVGRFGWKDQHASLLSFSGDAYLNEMGITNRLQPDEVTNLCNTASEPNDTPGPDGLADIDHFARFVRATKAPARDAQLADSPLAKKGADLFDKVGCSTCHVQTLTTAPAGTKINGGTFTIPAALGEITFHPYGDFLLHDVGTGDGIVQSMEEHYGRRMYQTSWKNLSIESFRSTQNKIRTAPLWGVRLRPRLMHDGTSLTFRDAILRHGGEAEEVTERFKKLKKDEQEAVSEFLKSL